MQKIATLCLALCTFASSFAQTDTTGKKAPDTIQIGGMVIIREKGAPASDTGRSRTERIFNIKRRNNERPSNITTNWWIVDLGFANFNDNTPYGTPAINAIAPGLNEDNFQARPGKSRSVDIWVFMQKINLIKHVVNLKYGLGVELNNYHFDDRRLRINKNPVSYDLGYSNTNGEVILSKNKLAADYLTMPVMLNFNFTPNKARAYGLSAGVSAGYLYSSRQKTKIDGDKDKVKGDLGLRKFKLAYVGELSLGIVKIYGSYAFKSMFDNGLDMTPYTVGLRFSN